MAKRWLRAGRFKRRTGKDRNEDPIVQGLRAAGVPTFQLDARSGLPDLLVLCMGRIVLFEVKIPVGPRGGASKTGQRLRDSQKKFHALCKEYGCPVYTVTSIEEALEAINMANEDPATTLIALRCVRCGSLTTRYGIYAADACIKPMGNIPCGGRLEKATP